MKTLTVFKNYFWHLISLLQTKRSAQCLISLIWILVYVIDFLSYICIVLFFGRQLDGNIMLSIKFEIIKDCIKLFHEEIMA